MISLELTEIEAHMVRSLVGSHASAKDANVAKLQTDEAKRHAMRERDDARAILAKLDAAGDVTGDTAGREQS